MPKFAKEIIVPKSYAINNTNPRASLDVLVILSIKSHTNVWRQG